MGHLLEQPLVTAHVDGIGIVMVLEAVKQINKEIKIYHASTSELYGNNKEIVNNVLLTENSLFWPVSPYASSKLYAYHQVRIYREAYGMFAVNGILFNHESPLRGLEFVTRKISNAVARIKLGLQKQVELGNIEAKRDWGYAQEYIEAMWLMLQQPQPQDFVIATGQTHSVKEFIELSCQYLDLDPEKILVQSEQFYRPLDINCLMGDATKAKRILNWEPKVTFKELVNLMVQTDLERWGNHLRGEIFPWDAINDPSIYHVG